MKNIDNPKRSTYYFYTWRPIDNSIPFDYVYVGSTLNVKSRKYLYKKNCLECLTGNSEQYFQPIVKIITKYGWDKFKMKVIGTANQMTITEARIREQEYIDDIKNTKHVTHQDEEYAENGATVLLNATSAYDARLVKKSGCITYEEHIDNGRKKFNLKVSKYRYIWDVINNSQICNIEYTQQNNGEVHKIEYYGLLSSWRVAVELYYAKLRYEKKYANDDTDDDVTRELRAIYNYNCPIIRTETFDNRDRQLVLEHLQKTIEELEQDELE